MTDVLYWICAVGECYWTEEMNLMKSDGVQTNKWSGNVKKTQSRQRDLVLMSGYSSDGLKQQLLLDSSSVTMVINVEFHLSSTSKIKASLNLFLY